MEVEEAIIPLHSPTRRVVRPWHVMMLLVLGIFVVGSQLWAQAADGRLLVRMLDVGQGDAIFITTPSGNQILIDGGPDGSILSKLGHYMPSWDTDIDVVIATHKDSDHISGLVAVLERYQIDTIVHGYERKETGVGRAWELAVVAEGASVTEGIAGLQLELGASTSLTILYPYESRDGVYIKKGNDASLVMMLRHEQVRILLTGDAEASTERKLVMDKAPLRADILQVGHHGSKTSTTTEFVSAVSPQATLISVGENNRYGHPHFSVIARLESFGIPYYSTAQKGDVTVTSDGRSFFITSQY